MTPTSDDVALDAAVTKVVEGHGRRSFVDFPAAHPSAKLSVFRLFTSAKSSILRLLFKAPSRRFSGCLQVPSRQFSGSSSKRQVVDFPAACKRQVVVFPAALLSAKLTSGCSSKRQS